MQRRRNYFIKKKFQMNFIVKFGLLLLLESILIIALFMYISKNTLTTGYAHSILKVENTQNFFIIPFTLVSLICFTAIGLAGMIVFTLFSHRIAGPLYRFEKILQQIGAGDLTANIKLRKKDQLEEFEKLINILVNTLDNRMGSIKRNLEQAQELLLKIDDPEAVSELNKKFNLIKDEINHFKVTADLKTKQ
ncbi:MAG: hypothetical protein A2Y03_03065 [Omnitrophica WOR_2 bacterium GWF2_38_59]|nr:MAG: hypothetical protein A2Y03_03065 [Omnitrophica WOR_2 bacterium GWF2_38_59]